MWNSSETRGADVEAPLVEALEARIRALPGLSIAELRQAWVAAWGAPPPKGARRRLLMLGIAWQWQAELYGGFSRSAERRLALLEADSAERCSDPEHSPGRRRRGSGPGQPPDPGLEGGAARSAGYRDRLSLARPELGLAFLAVAREVTGTRRNGPAFSACAMEMCHDAEPAAAAPGLEIGEHVRALGGRDSVNGRRGEDHLDASRTGLARLT